MISSPAGVIVTLTRPCPGWIPKNCTAYTRGKALVKCSLG